MRPMAPDYCTVSGKKVTFFAKSCFFGRFFLGFWSVTGRFGPCGVGFWEIFEKFFKNFLRFFGQKWAKNGTPRSWARGLEGRTVMILANFFKNFWKIFENFTKIFGKKFFKNFLKKFVKIITVLGIWPLATRQGAKNGPFLGHFWRQKWSKNGPFFGPNFLAFVKVVTKFGKFLGPKIGKKFQKIFKNFLKKFVKIITVLPIRKKSDRFSDQKMTRKSIKFLNPSKFEASLPSAPSIHHQSSSMIVDGPSMALLDYVIERSGRCWSIFRRSFKRSFWAFTHLLFTNFFKKIFRTTKKVHIAAK